jgi:hypothetical protein
MSSDVSPPHGIELLVVDGFSNASTVSDSLEAAGIRPERCGRGRAHGLSDAERELYHWVLRHFAERGRPSGADLRAGLDELGLDRGAALARLAREDLVHLDPAGEIAVAYPFSGQPTRHRVELAARHAVDAMCAIDALGMAAMLDQPIEIHSSDPMSGESITVRVEPSGEAAWNPAGAVVLAGSQRHGPSYQGSCGVLNFFASPANAERYLVEHTNVVGQPITIPDGVAAGTAIFGEALAS